MKFNRLTVTLAVFTILLPTVRVAFAVEPVLEFTEGLRQRGYFDYALIYLDEVEKNSKTPADIQKLIPYERAVTLLQGANALRSPEAQAEQLDQALAQLESFVKSNPSHELAGQANTERARILIGRARVEVWHSRSPSNETKKAEYQQNARKLVAQARKVFQQAHDQHQAAWKSYPVYIDKQTEPEKFDARREAEVRFIRAQLDLALCTYEEAQTYDRGSKEFNDKLNQASKEFEKIHATYRSQVGGLYARMWEGKCFEEQDEIGKALGIYNELLSHPGQSGTMKTLQNQVRQFRLICLNHKDRKDYQLVVQEAEAWLQQNRRLQRTKIGLGIRWELTRALDFLSSDRNLPERNREQMLRQALAVAREVNRYPGEYKDVSTFMISKLLGKLGREAGDPEDFETAIGIARNMVNEIKKIKDEQDAAKTKEDRAKLQEELDNHLAETARMLNLALKLATESTEPAQVNNARYLLSYVYYLNRHSYEAAVLGEFIAKHYAKDDSQQALDAAYLAMAAYVQGYNQSPEDQKAVDAELMQQMCDLITTSWPESDRANDARMNMGQIFNQMKRPVDAAKYYSAIPTAAPQYAKAQTAAGQAYWNGYLSSLTADEKDKPSTDELKKWQTQAKNHLQTGIKALSDKIPSATASPPELIAAKLSLTQILLSEGQYQPAIDLLKKDPHSVIKAVSVEDESKRPKKKGDIKSAEIASLAYQLLLRAYVGTQQIPQARETMGQLEKVAGGDSGGEAVTEIYRQLGEKISEEIDQLRAAGDKQRLKEVRQSLENFLGDLAVRKDQTYGSLIWMAETYYGLGQGSQDDASAAAKYFQQAADAYQKILARKDITPQQRTAVQLRLVHCKRRAGQYEEALALVKQVLQQLPKALDAQIEAAYIYQDWAGSGKGDSWKKYQLAMHGDQSDATAPIWGWGHIAKLLQQNILNGTASESYRQKYYEARYNSALSRRKYALEQGGDDRKQSLEAAQFELQAFAAVSGNVDDTWWKKFDELYQQVLRDQGEIARPLEKSQPVAVTAPKPAQAAAPEQQAAPTQQTAQAPAPKTNEPGMMAYAMMLGIVVVGIIIVVFFSLKGSKRRVKVGGYAAAEPTSFQPPPVAPQQRRRVPSKKPASSAASQQAQPPQRPQQGQPAKQPQGQPVKKRPPQQGGQRPAGQAPPQGQAPTGQTPAGQAPPGQRPVKKRPAGQQPPQQGQPVKKKRPPQPPQQPPQE